MESIVNQILLHRRMDESQVGAFFFLGDSIVSNNTDVRDGEAYGDYVNFSSHWDLWKAFVKEYTEYKDFDYDYFPRGRVIFSKKLHKYILYIDPKLNKDKYLDKIKDVYHLSSGSYILGDDDEHYTSIQPEYDIVED